MKYFYPLHINTNIGEIKFHDSSILRRISNEELLTFFGFSNVERNQNGLIKKSTVVGRGGLNIELTGLILANRGEIISSNFIFETKNGRKDAQIFNKALKLLKAGRTGVTIGFNDKTPAVEFLHPNPFYHKHPLYSLSSKGDEDKTLADLYKKIKCIVNPKFGLMIDKFLFALSGENIREENRFVDLMAILEILLLPDGFGELKFRLSLRISNIFAKQYNRRAKDVYYDFANNRNGLYKIRSEILHKGKSESLTDEQFSKSESYTRSMLKLYLYHPEKFTKEKLIDVCLKN